MFSTLAREAFFCDLESFRNLKKKIFKNLKNGNFLKSRKQKLSSSPKNAAVRKEEGKIKNLIIYTNFNQCARTFYATKRTKNMKNMMRTPKILIISQRFLETDWKYFRISLCAMSTFSSTS
jgi:hypothetical protein